MSRALPVGLLFALVGIATSLAARSSRAESPTSDGAYGRFDGDLGLSLEAGVSEALGAEPHRGEALAVRAGALYVQTVGLAVQYDEGLGLEALPMRRVVAGVVELRPLFWGRFTENLEQGPAVLDLWLDSLALSVGIFGAWPQDRFCDELGGDGSGGGCTDYGMQLGLGFELPLIGDASAPFIGLRSALRWSLRERSAAFESPPVSGLLTLTLGYRHLFDIHLVDAGDALPR